ncbi:MAG: hypothetical protein FJY16_07580 [Bacteroidetes bacterium]|nr:hypothetical protein [Bacteroidota bacterium]
MKLPRISKPIFNVLIGPLLLLILGIAIWRVLGSSQQWPLFKGNLHLIFTEAQLLPFLLLGLLMPLNWLLEALKWKMALQGIQPISIWTAFRATLSGVSFSVLLPNRVGDYLGRVVYLPPEIRATAVAVTMVASMSQLIWTIFFGLLSIIYLYPLLATKLFLPSSFYILAGSVLSVLLLILLLLFFRISIVSVKLSLLINHPRFTSWMKGPQQFTQVQLLRLLGLSLIRYIIFLFQYGAALAAFMILLNPLDWIAGICFTFLVLSVVPNFAVADLGVRGFVSVGVLGFFTLNKAGILLAVSSVWFVNLMFPAAMGALSLIGVQKFWKHVS